MSACMLRYISHVSLFATLWTVVHQSSLSSEFSRQVSWSGLPCPHPGDLPNPETEPSSLMSPALAGGSLPPASPGKPIKRQAIEAACVVYNICRSKNV